MLFSTDWLSDYVDLPESPEALAEVLTAGGFAVEGIEATGSTETEGDTVLDVDVTTNRVDAMNHFGLAREIAVLRGVALREPETGGDPPGGPEAGGVSVTIEDPERCTRFAARVVRGVTVGPSPDWMARRLLAIGHRPINNVVDVTNYVLWEIGQPLHAFDLAKLARSAGEPTSEDTRIEIRVRAAGDDDRLTTLDGQERVLEPDTLVVADASGAISLAGIMGGESTEVGDDTRDVLLEGAWWDPRTIRSTAKRLGMHTDASHRFERGADPEIQARAVNRAAALIAEVGGGTVDPETIDAVAPTHDERHRRPTIALDLDRLDAFAGLPMPEGKPAEWLAGLGFEVRKNGPGGDRRLSATVPSWRLSDVSETADLYEEVMRIHGFDTIPATLPDLGVPDGPPTGRQLLRRRVRRILSAAGYAEAIQWAFLSREAVASVAPLGTYEGQGAEAESPVVLDNPLSELYSTLRRSLLPGLLEAARFNTRRGAGSVRLFELGVVFGRSASGRSASGEEVGGVVEREALGLVCGGAVGTPWEGRRELDLFDLKGAVEAVAEAAGKRLEARPAEVHGLLPGTSAVLSVAGRRVGVLGRLAEDDEHDPLYAAEIELATLESTPEELHAALAVDAPPRLPGIEVDHTLTHPVEVAWADLAAAIREHAAEDLRSFRLENRYEGKGVPEGAVNTTFHLLYHGGERQLTQDEVNRHQEALVGVLEERFGWKGESS